MIVFEKQSPVLNPTPEPYIVSTPSPTPWDFSYPTPEPSPVHKELSLAPTDTPTYRKHKNEHSDTVHVKGYYRKDGTYVQPHTRRSAHRD
ncbi:hypothetical protein MBAV_002329 [Candidatus Magnetobacterium bavaricum]|uniref:Uncharacterized protein n=1 Tax=Candidatus Magnetobacterium bavaricum TaxID=29290 RepID=A0A0F3GUG4_9BACT|nr:hypothetical protein MBAV_002329 [Candidatus Magnetobacterium bavaricum]